MAKFLFGIEYEERNGSGQVTISENGIQGKRIFTVDWGDAHKFARSLMYTMWECIGGFLIQKSFVHTWELPDGTILGCNTSDIQGIGKSKDDIIIAYDRATITANYTVMDTPAYTGKDEEELGDVALGYSAEFLTTAADTWKYADTGYKINEPMGLLMPYQELTINLRALEELPRTGIRACLGRLNDKPWQGAGTGQVLFLGATSRQSWSSVGVRPHEVMLKFKERPIDWNKVLGKDGLWHTVVDVKTGTKNPYDYANFSLILQV